MTELRHLTFKEINEITSGVRHQKSDIKNILRAKGKIYKLSQGDISKLRKKLESLSSDSDIPRYLSEKEIDYLLDELPEIPSCVKEIREFNRKQIIDSLKFDLRTFKICPKRESLKNLKKNITETYLRSLCQAGHSAGCNGAMALGATMTQTALDAFHTSGTENSHEEEQKILKDLMTPSSKKTASSYNVHYIDKDLTKEEILRTHQKKIQGINFSDLVLSSDLLESVPPEDMERYDNYSVIYSKNIDTSNKFMRVKLNTYKCYTHGITLSEISNVLEKTTKSQSGRNTIYCVHSSNFEGIIDIHVDTEFLASSVQEFAEKGKTFKACEKRFRGKTIETEDGDKRRTYLKTVFDINARMEDLIYIFLQIILKEECFSNILLKGIKDVENINVVDHNLSTFIKFKKVWDDKEVSKYLSSDYDVKPDEFYRLYYCYIEYHAMHIIGIPGEKFIRYIEACGMKLIDNQISSEPRPYCVFLLPEVPDIKISGGEDIPEEMVGQNRYEKVDSSVIDRVTGKTVITPEEPMSLLARKIQEAKDILRDSILDENSKMDLTDFPPVYRYGIYCYLKVYGKNILSSLLKDKNIDPYFTCSNNVNEVIEYYGIESSRLFFVREYQTIGDIQKMNPVNIELLVDFQTATGQIFSVTSTDIAKHGKNSLVSASFQQPLEAFRKSGSIGSTDLINNVPSCLMTGKQCTNGTGASEVSFDSDYMNNPENKFSQEKFKDINITSVNNKNILGNCFGSGNYVKDDGNSDEEENSALDATEEYMPTRMFEESSEDIDVETRKFGNIDDSVFDI